MLRGQIAETTIALLPQQWPWARLWLRRHCRGQSAHETCRSGPTIIKHSNFTAHPVQHLRCMMTCGLPNLGPELMIGCLLGMYAAGEGLAFRSCKVGAGRGAACTERWAGLCAAAWITSVRKARFPDPDQSIDGWAMISCFTAASTVCGFRANTCLGCCASKVTPVRIASCTLTGTATGGVCTTVGFARIAGPQAVVAREGVAETVLKAGNCFGSFTSGRSSTPFGVGAESSAGAVVTFVMPPRPTGS
mmetsp:Transcript_91334/g.229592  ORF Transcript_91334/g.229592 Transcript_91334/m.229592 type:complete len:248 (+) Transcript_91334:130-873(+)